MQALQEDEVGVAFGRRYAPEFAVQFEDVEPERGFHGHPSYGLGGERSHGQDRGASGPLKADVDDVFALEFEVESEPIPAAMESRFTDKGIGDRASVARVSSVLPKEV